MEHGFWIGLTALCLVLAWQDWKAREVNFALAMVTVVLLLVAAPHRFQAGVMLAILGGYRYFRKDSIQTIDIIAFGAGAGHFSQQFLPIYCLVTALTLWGIFKGTKACKLPFLTAWAGAFLGARLLQALINS